MKNLVGAALAVTLLGSGTAFAVDIVAAVNGSKIISYDAGKRLLTVRLGLSELYTKLGCTVDAKVNVPASISAGRDISFSYTGEGAGFPGGDANNNNVCTVLSLQ